MMFVNLLVARNSAGAGVETGSTERSFSSIREGGVDKTDVKKPCECKLGARLAAA